MKKIIIDVEKTTAMLKLLKLQEALSDCGVESTVVESDGVIYLTVDTYMCTDGQSASFVVGGCDQTGYDLDAVVEPTDDLSEYFEE
jgi:uncharacterized ParB-like nuclease family protein